MSFESSINEMLSHVDVLSLDIFDTAILRRVARPSNLFLLMEEELVKQHGPAYCNFSKIRKSAEEELYARHWSHDRTREISLFDIYSQVLLQQPEYTVDLTTLCELEIAYELKVCYQNPYIAALVNSAVSQGKSVIFITDIYHSLDTINQLLDQCGYKNYTDLFVSSELKKNKASGSIFPHVIDKLGVDPRRILHVGDSYHSDYFQPSQFGLQSYSIPKGSDLEEFATPAYSDSSPADSVALSVCQNYLAANPITGAFGVGFTSLGPLLFGFSTWLRNHCKNNNITKIYFIAREGWLLQKAFDQLESLLGKTSDSFYFLASRRSLFFATLSSENFIQDLFKFLVSAKPVKLSKYLSTIDLELSSSEIQKYGYSSLDQIVDPYNNEKEKDKICRLFEDNKKEILANAQSEKLAYITYLKSLELDKAEKIAIVDSGWFGNGQPCIKTVVESVNPNCEVFGYYFALHQEAQSKLGPKSVADSYLYHFDDAHNNLDNFLVLARLVEVFLTAPYHSLKKLTQIESGEVKPVYLNSHEEVQVHESITLVQEGALSYINKAQQEVSNLTSTHLDHQAIRQRFIRLINSPTLREAQVIGDLPYEGNLVDSDDDSRFAKPSTKIKIYSLLRLIQEYNNSNWKAAYYIQLPNYLKLLLKISNIQELKKTRFYRKLSRFIRRFIRR